MRNFLIETLEFMRKHRYNEYDVLYCTIFRDQHLRFSFDVFKKNANFRYNNSYGCEEVDSTLRIIFKNGYFMERDTYDGAEWWVMKMPLAADAELCQDDIDLHFQHSDDEEWS